MATKAEERARYERLLEEEVSLGYELDELMYATGMDPVERCRRIDEVVPRIDKIHSALAECHHAWAFEHED